jgi:hypothetical protein
MSRKSITLNNEELELLMKLPKRILTVVILMMVIIGFLAPHFVNKPEIIDKVDVRQRSIIISGLSPIGRVIMRAVTIVFFAGVLIILISIYKLDASLSDEKDVLRLRRYCKLYQYFLFISAIIAVVRIVLAIFGLSTINHINYAYIVHSWILDGGVGLIILVWFFLSTYNYVKAVQKLPPSIVLSNHKNLRL